MRVPGVCHAAVLLTAGLVVGCGSDGKPTPPPGDPAPPRVEASAPVSAELDRYMSDGNVFVEVLPTETIRKIMSRQPGYTPAREIDWELWTGRKTVTFVRGGPDGKLFKVVGETKGQDKSPVTDVSHALLASDGLYAANESGAKVTAIPIIPTELAVGKEWEGTHPKAAAGTGKSFGRIEAKETVEVPAGKFEAYKISLGTAGHPLVTSIWYTPGVGIVKDGRPSSGLELKEIKRKP